MNEPGNLYFLIQDFNVQGIQPFAARTLSAPKEKPKATFRLSY
jgi:hypothetical protein